MGVLFLKKSSKFNIQRLFRAAFSPRYAPNSKTCDMLECTDSPTRSCVCVCVCVSVCASLQFFLFSTSIGWYYLRNAFCAKVTNIKVDLGTLGIGQRLRRTESAFELL